MEKEIITTAYETCPGCFGSGYSYGSAPMEANLPDGTTFCRECNNTGFVRMRDEKGRYAKKIVPLKAGEG